MNPANSYYGNTLPLAWWVGLATPPPVWGTLQHAWMEDLPFQEFDVQSRRWPFLAYSERNRAEAVTWAVGAFDVVAIGDPFLYLAALLGGPVRRVGSSPLRTIAYPTHHDGSDETIPRHDELAEAYLEAEGPDLTVCLHWREHSNARLRAVYEQRGFEVLCHGLASDRLFLVRQHATLLRHDRVISNHIGTAMLHGGVLGLQMEITGPPFDKYDPWTTAADMRAREQERWPELFDGGTAGEQSIALANEELGAEHVRPPEELAVVLGWTTPRRQINSALERGLAVRRRWSSFVGRGR
jgi:hypothetical protein